MLLQNVLAKSLDKQFGINYSTTVCNGVGNSDGTSFVGDGVGQSCGCETAEGDQH